MILSLLRLKEFFSLALLIVLLGCSTDEEKKLYSTDLSALKKIVVIPDEILAAKWEIFNSPEYASIPGPSDFIALVTEIDVKDQTFLLRDVQDREDEYIVPQASRPWLSKEFKALMAKHENSRVKISQLKECSAYSTKVSKSGRTVTGIACVVDNKKFIYLLLQSAQ